MASGEENLVRTRGMPLKFKERESGRLAGTPFAEEKRFTFGFRLRKTTGIP
jgi:hypothetical protein